MQPASTQQTQQRSGRLTPRLSAVVVAQNEENNIGRCLRSLRFADEIVVVDAYSADRTAEIARELGARVVRRTWDGFASQKQFAIDQARGIELLAACSITRDPLFEAVLAWAYWWNSTEELPEQITNEQVLIELNTDFSMKGMSAQEIVSVVKAWQSGALSRDSMLDLFRRGEILPEGRTNDEETTLIDAEKSDLPPAPRADAASAHSAAVL